MMDGINFCLFFFLGWEGGGCFIWLLTMLSSSFKVPVRVAGGLLFELLGQSAGDPFVDEDDIPIVLRSWQAQNFLITALHVKGPVSSNNVLGITEVQVVHSLMLKL